MKKKLLAYFFSLALILTAVLGCSMVVSAEEIATSGSCGEAVTWSYDETTSTLIISGTGAMADYAYNVSAPWTNLDVKNVVIGDGITSIGEYAFEDMDTLESVTGAKDVEVIKRDAFSGSSNLKTFHIGNKVTTIDMYAFSEANGLESITGGEALVEIGQQAFYKCTNLATLPEFPSVTTIKSSALANTKWISSQGDFPIINGLLVQYVGESLEVVIPDTVKGFVEGSLSATKITKVTFADSMTVIPENTFFRSYYSNSSLKEVVLGKNTKEIGEGAFRACKALTTIKLPDTLTKIGNNAFYQCASLKAIEIPDGTYVGNGAFRECTTLTTLKALGTKSYLGEYAFYETTLALDSVSIGKIGFGNNVFKETEIEYYYGNCGTGAMWNIDANGTMTVYPFGTGETAGVMTQYPNTDGDKYNSHINTAFKAISAMVKNVIVEEGIKELARESFHEYVNMESITLPTGIKTIPYRTFAGTTALKTIVIPEGVELIDQNAFIKSGIQTIVLPKTVKEIGYDAFADTANLQSLTIPESVTKLNSRFLDGSAVKELVLEADMLYTSDAFNDVAMIEKLVIKNGRIGSSDSWGSSVFYDSASTLKELVIGKDVKLVGSSAFAEMSALENVTFEEGAYTEIKNNAFTKCTSLKEVEFPKTIIKIGKNAFEECTNLEKVTFYEGLKTIDAYAFFSCPKLKMAEIPLSVTTIGTYAFNAYWVSGDGIKEDYVADYYDGFLMRGYINTEAERYAVRTPGTTFEPMGGDISSCSISLSPSSFDYDGTAKTPTVTVKTYYGTVLVEGTMYTAPVYTDNIEAGKGKATITGIAPYTGTKSKEFTINKPVDPDEGGEDDDKPGSSEGATITAEGMQYMYEVLQEYGLVIDGAIPEDVPMAMIVEVFKSYGYEAADAYKTLEHYGITTGGGSGTTPDPEECEKHDWKTWETVKEATCKETGLKKRGCKVCKATEEKEIPKLTTHSYNEGTVIEKATCTKEGTLEKECTICGKTNTEDIAKLPHETVKAKRASFDVEGTTAGIHCSMCGRSDVKVIPAVKEVKLSYTSATYSGSVKKPSVTIKTTNNKTLSTSNYSVSYESGRKYPGEYDVTVTLKGNYEGQEVLTFKIQPKAPTSVKATLTDASIVKVTWKKATGAMAYRVYVAPYNTKAYELYAEEQGTSAVIGLDAGVKYSFKVVPCFESKTGFEESTKSASTSLTTLATVSGVSVEKYSSTKVRVRWTNVANETGYDIARIDADGVADITTYKSTSGKSKVVKADANEEFSYRVRAYKYVNGKRIEGKWSEAVPFTLRNVKAVKDVKATLYEEPNKVKVTWSEVPTATGYNVSVKKGTGTYKKLGYTEDIEYIAEGLDAGAKYTFKVQPCYVEDGKEVATGTSDTSVVYTLKQMAKPKAAKSSSQVRITWTNISGESGYEVSQSTSEEEFNVVKTWKTTSGTSTKLSADKGVTYYYRVRAFKTVGENTIYGEWSDAREYTRK